MNGSDVLNALHGLRQVKGGDAHHSLHDIWWPVRDLGSTGDVERLLIRLWETEEVENPADGRWRLPTGVEVQMAMGEVPEAWGAA